MTKYFTALLMFFVASPTFAADLNGYAAKYECRRGGSFCNVDVSSLAAKTCDQVITTNTSPATDWSAIKWSNNVICIEAGDHTARGVLNVQSSGTATAYKVLRYYRYGDTNDDPWRQAATSQATIKNLNMNGMSYWLVERLTINSNQTTTAVIFNGSHNILDRSLVENLGSFFSTEEANQNNIQNSVMRNFKKEAYKDIGCINTGWTTDEYIVNNEFYGCTDGVVATQGSPSIQGSVIENNDFWVPAAYQKDADHNCVENAVDIKAGGTSSKPVKVIHNRAWGFKATSDCGGTGDNGSAMLVHCPSCQGGADYVMFQDNIITDSQGGIWTPNAMPHYISYIGNLLYNITSPLHSIYALQTNKADAAEMYLNTIVHADRDFLGGSNTDVRCNVFIAAGDTAGSGGTGTQINFNVYYGTAGSGDSSSVQRALNTRANSRNYAVGDIVRLSSTPQTSCTSENSPNCFLYLVTTAGTSATTPPLYCAKLGCTVTDGTVQLHAVRAPYVYRRKLRTVSGGELAVIPYAKADLRAPEYQGCDPNLGTRPQVGISGAPIF